MKIKVLVCLVLFSFAMLLHAGESLEEKKKGILLVTFGTSYPEARKAFDHIDERVKERCPGIDVHWAYTAKFIREKLKGQAIHTASPAEALANMGEAGYTHVAVQSLHFIPGSEYHDLLQTVDAFNGLPKSIKRTVTGKPLIYKHEDLKRMASIICDIFPVQENEKEAVLFMGHGSHHGANVYYPAFQYYLDDFSNVHFIGTVEGYPLFEDVINRLKRHDFKSIKLVPFMSVAGDHAQNDMASENSDSWKSMLEAEGFETGVVMRGLAENDEVVDIWIDHLKDVMNEL